MNVQVRIKGERLRNNGMDHDTLTEGERESEWDHEKQNNKFCWEYFEF
jgi:hypothetical protein